MIGRNGFTLIEMLAALVAGSGILVTLSWSVSILSTMLAASRPAGVEEQAANASLVLTSLLSGARPRDESENGFNGQARELSTTISPPRAAAAAGPLRLTLAIRHARDGEQLIARAVPLRTTQKFPAAAGQPHLLLTKMRRMSFDYGDEVGETGLPSLITLRFEDQKRHARRIQIAPRLTTDGSCRFDPISQTCRP